MDGIAPPAEPWLRDATDVAAELATDLQSGLTAAEATARLEVYGRNRLDEAASVPAWRRLVAQFLDPLIYLLLFAVV
ncbi:MAG TPA: cation-transporting P-type ATPase, partial [Ilumatobacteraceae bacterium]|nr:cation-transporting P-type ATPase [Ilumatobacteraceae bacterium]